MGLSGPSTREKVGRLTFFGRAPDWKRDAYVEQYKEAAHLISSRKYGTVHTFCGHDMLDSGLQQVIVGGGGHVRSWEGLHRCYYCERRLQKLKEEIISQDPEATEENWRERVREQAESDYLDRAGRCDPQE